MKTRLFVKAVSLLSAVAVMLSTGGCYDRRELNTLAMVIGAGVDKGEAEGEVSLVMQIAKVSGGKAGPGTQGSGGGESDKGYANVVNSGKSIHAVVRDSEHKISRRIYVAHNQVLIFGEELAKAGLRDSLDFFARAPEARMTVFLLIAKKAKDILEIDPEYEKLPASEIASLIKTQRVTADVPIVTEFEFLNEIICETTAAVAPYLEVVEAEGKKQIEASGCAVFKDDRMIGKMSKAETRGMLWLKGKVKSAVIPIEVMGQVASAEVKKSQTKLKVTVEDGIPTVAAKIEVTVGLSDQTGTINLADVKAMPAVMKATEDVIKSEIELAFAKSAELKADVFGFGERIGGSKPKEWKKMKPMWDELYPKIRLNIDVTVNPDGSGRSVLPLAPEKGM